MYKFHYDIGYDEETDALFNKANNEFPGTHYQSLNQNNVWFQAGFNFSFIGGPHKLNGPGEVDDGGRIAFPFAGGAGGQQWTAGPGQARCAINCNDNPRGLCNNYGGDSYVCDGVERECYGVLMSPPRCYLIHPQMAIACQHYCPIYKQCGEMDGEPKFIRFYHKVGDNPEDLTAGYYDAEVWARRLIGAGLGSGGGGGCYRYDPSTCNVPSGIKDVESPYPEVVSACASDQVLIVFKNPVPSFIRPAKLPTAEFMRKYYDETTNPDTAQSGRMTIRVDQYLRPLLTYDNFEVYENPDTTVHVPFGCNDDYTDVEVLNPLTSQSGYGRPNRGGNWLLSSIEGQYGIGGPFGHWSRGVASNAGGEVVPGFGTYLPSSEFIPTEKSLEGLAYDFRDGIYSAAWAGDSGSALFLPLNINEDGYRDIAYYGAITSAGNGGNFWAIRNWKEALERICDEHELAYPDYVDENYDFSSGTTPLSSRPTLGYKIYKSTTDKDGPYFDITHQTTPWNENVTIPDVTGIPCVDSNVPCYTKSENFMDTAVEAGEKYWYYITTLESIEGTPVPIESEPSEVIEIEVPIDWHYTDERKLFVSRDSANEGIRTTISEPEVCITDPESSLDNDLIHVCTGFRQSGSTDSETGGLATNEMSIPLLGFTDPFNPPIGTDGSVEEPCLYTKVISDGSETDVANKIRPYPKDNTSFQYILGYPYDCEGTPEECPPVNKLTLRWTESDRPLVMQWKDSVNYLNFSRPTRQATGANEVYLDNYFHSSINCFNTNGFPNVETLIINPAYYGNGRNVYGEDWSYGGQQEPGVAESYLGFYAGEYLFDDINGYLPAPPLKTLIAKDASVSTDDTPSHFSFEYFKTRSGGPGSPTEMLSAGLKHLDLSGNGLFLLDLGCVGEQYWQCGYDLEYVDLSDNNLGSSPYGGHGNWLADDSFPSYPQAGEMPGSGHFVDFLKFHDRVKYVNISNNPDFNTTEHVQGKYIQYLNLANTNVGARIAPSVRQAFQMSSLWYLENAILDNTSLEDGLHLIHSSGRLKTLNAEGTMVPYIAPYLQETNEQNGGLCASGTHLEKINLRGSPNIESLNLHYSWDEDGLWQGRYGNNWEAGHNHPDGMMPGSRNYPRFYGMKAPRLKEVDVTNCTNLKRLYLPPAGMGLAYGASDCLLSNIDFGSPIPANWEKEYLTEIIAGGNKLGINGTLEQFLSQEAFSPDDYPEGHYLYVDCRYQFDSDTGDSVSTSWDFVQQKMIEWTDQGKFIDINIDVHGN